MELPDLKEARKRTDKEIKHIFLDDKYDENTFKGQKYFIRTYGCQMNVHDSEEIAARLESVGFTSTDTIEGADIVILNTVKKASFDGETLFVKNKSDIDKWYKKMTKEVFLDHLNEVYNRFSVNVPYPKLVIRKMTTRWGVNNVTLKKITLNSELIYKDTKYLDYVIVHELSHFKHHNHGKGFWSLVEENEPNYKRIRKELQE